MSAQQIALVLDIGASLPNPHPRPDGTLRTYESGGSLKIRAFDAETRETVLEYSSDQEFRRTVAEQRPEVWLAHAARLVERVLDQHGIPHAAVTYLVNGFPAYIAHNMAFMVANLRFQEGGEWVHWTNVDIGSIWQRELAGSFPNLRNVLVVNDLVLGLGAYLVERAATIEAGDHILYAMPGGGLGVAEVVGLGDQLLLMGSEQGHNFYVPEAPLRGEAVRAERLEAGYASSTAFERNYEQLTGRALPFIEVVRAAHAGDADAMTLVDRFIEGMAYLTSHGVNRGVNRIVITGNVARLIDEVFADRDPHFIQTGILARFEQIARMDLYRVNEVTFDHFEAADNTQGGIALIRARAVSGQKGGLLLVPATL